MKFGTNVYQFPRFRDDLADLVQFVRTADELGYHHMRFLDHVVGIVADRHGGIAETPYTSESSIRECFTLMAYLASMTKQIRFVTGVVALPMRQTVLVAKQAAEIDIYTGGRLTLGVGIGYNPVEFEALGAEFKTRAPRFEEQVDVLRKLWTEDVVNYDGRWHKITDASLAPLPIQQPIPLWFGVGRTNNPIPPDPVLDRVGRLADGWMPMISPNPAGREALAKVQAAAASVGRSPEDVALEMNLNPVGKGKGQITKEVEELREFGASQINVNFGANTANDQIEALSRFREQFDMFF